MHRKPDSMARRASIDLKLSWIHCPPKMRQGEQAQSVALNKMSIPDVDEDISKVLTASPFNSGPSMVSVPTTVDMIGFEIQDGLKLLKSPI